MHATPASPTLAQVTQVARPLTGTTPLRASPAGRIVAHIGLRTPFGSSAVLSVEAQRGDWLAVLSPALPNGRVGWVRASEVRLARVAYVIVVDLSQRRLSLERRGRVVRRMTVGIGSPSSPTPTGDFAVTDELAGNAVYGCCILALSGHQPHPPPGWPGGTRLAIHGGSVNGAVSAGCVHLDDADLRYLMTTVPLGTRVVIRP